MKASKKTSVVINVDNSQVKEAIKLVEELRIKLNELNIQLSVK